MKGKKAQAIDHFLKRNGYLEDWKISVGTKVANSANVSDIPIEIQTIIRKIVG
ncbi:MAG TPA: hypothetical protein VK209_07545 [Candidatus Sulfotelmatobacter sp.]|nr:hypothetical protein [Candidatus Sulfotelmatobacter sp.]